MKKSFLSFPLAVLLTAAGLSAGEKLYQPELTQQVQPGPAGISPERGTRQF